MTWGTFKIIWIQILSLPCQNYKFTQANHLLSMGISFWNKSLTQLSDFTFTFHFHALEKEMATHSSVLAWRIPGMAEPGGLPSMELQRVRHDWSDLAAAAAILHCVYVPQLSYPFVCLWTSRLLPCPGYYKQCCDEYWGTRVSFPSAFLSVYAQQWDCWVIRQFYFQFFKESPHCSP